MELSDGLEDIEKPYSEYWVGSIPLSLLSACLARPLSGSIGSCRSYGAMTRARPITDIDALVKLTDRHCAKQRFPYSRIWNALSQVMESPEWLERLQCIKALSFKVSCGRAF